MKTKLVAAIVLAVTACASAPVFASGYGPAPYYNPIVGAPSSEAGPSIKTLQTNGAGVDKASTSYGGVTSGSSQGGMRSPSGRGNACVGPVSFCNIYFGN